MNHSPEAEQVNSPELQQTRKAQLEQNALKKAIKRP